MKKIILRIFCFIILLSIFSQSVCGYALKTKNAVVHIDIATDNFLAGFDSHDIFTNTNQYGYDIISSIVFWTEKEVRDFNIIEIKWDINNEPVVLLPGKILYSSGKLTPEKPLVVNTIIEGGNDYFPVLGISYTDENNTKRYFYIPTAATGYFTLFEFMTSISPQTNDNYWLYYVILIISITMIFLFSYKKRISIE